MSTTIVKSAPTLAGRRQALWHAAAAVTALGWPLLGSDHLPTPLQTEQLAIGVGGVAMTWLVPELPTRSGRYVKSGVTALTAAGTAVVPYMHGGWAMLGGASGLIVLTHALAAVLGLLAPNETQEIARVATVVERDIPAYGKASPSRAASSMDTQALKALIVDAVTGQALDPQPAAASPAPLAPTTGRRAKVATGPTPVLAPAPVAAAPAPVDVISPVPAQAPTPAIEQATPAPEPVAAAAAGYVFGGDLPPTA